MSEHCEHCGAPTRVRHGEFKSQRGVITGRDGAATIIRWDDGESSGERAGAFVVVPWERLSLSEAE